MHSLYSTTICLLLSSLHRKHQRSGRYSFAKKGATKKNDFALQNIYYDPTAEVPEPNPIVETEDPEGIESIFK